MLSLKTNLSLVVKSNRIIKATMRCQNEQFINNIYKKWFMNQENRRSVIWFSRTSSLNLFNTFSTHELTQKILNYIYGLKSQRNTLLHRCIWQFELKDQIQYRRKRKSTSSISVTGNYVFLEKIYIPFSIVTVQRTSTWFSISWI